MNFFMLMGLTVFIYGMYLVLWKRNSYDVERTSMGFLLLPVAFFIANLFDEEAKLAENFIYTVALAGVLFIVVSMYVMLTGIQIKVVATPEEVIKVIKKTKMYKENKELNFGNKRIFVDEDGDKVRVFKNMQGYTVLTVRAMPQRLRAKVKRIRKKMIPLDQRKTAKTEGRTMIVMGILLGMISIIWF